jgi:hypothetical protein
LPCFFLLLLLLLTTTAPALLHLELQLMPRCFILLPEQG